MDEIVGTGRHLTPVELRAWTGLLDADRMMDEVLARHLQLAGHEMTHREYEVLVRLDGWGGRLRMAVLARQIVASASLITQTVDRLEQRGLVAREPAASGDGRGVEAVLTELGRRALADAAEEHAAIVRRLLIDRIGIERLEQVADALADVADHLRAHRRGDPCEESDCPCRVYGVL